MSKKMFKRSLALGALMAFVITGSAMAAEVTGPNGSYAGSGVNSLLYSDGTGISGWRENVEIKDVVGMSFIGNGIGDNDLTVNTTEGQITLTNVGNISTNNTWTERWFFNALGGTINVTADNLDIYTTKYGVLAQHTYDPATNVKHNGSIDIDVTGDINITTGWSTIYVSGMTGEDVASSVSLHAKNINLSAYNWKIAYPESYWMSAVYVGSENGKECGNSVTLAADESVNISGNIAVVANNGTSENKASVTISATNVLMTSGEKGISASEDASVTVTADNTTIVVNSEDVSAKGVYATNDADVTINGNVGITVKSEGATGIYVKDENSNVFIGGEGKTVNITAEGSGWVDGVLVFNGDNGDQNINTNSEVTLQADTLEIKAISTDSVAVGIDVGNDTTGESEKPNQVNVVAKDTIITATSGIKEADGAGEYYSVGIVNYSQGIVKINDGNVTINAGTAISTRGVATTEININNNEDYDVKITGDVSYSAAQDDATMVTKTTINLANSESFLKGNIVKTGNPEAETDPNGVTLGLANGATWTTVSDDTGNGENNFVNALNINNGILNVTNGTKIQVGVDEEDTGWSGTGTVVLENASVDQQVTLNKKSGEVTVATNIDGIDNMSDEQIAEALSDMQNAVVMASASEEAADYAAHSGKSALYDEVKIAMSDLVEGNTAALDKTVAAANVSVNDMVAVGLMSWRAEMNDMNKRMGELRNANGEHGVWVRMVRGESEYDNVKNQYNQYQLGYDEKLSVDKRWTVGAALSYTDAENSFAEGNGESTNKALSIYGSKLNADGTFIDLIAKYARLENDFKTYSGMGDADYDTNGYSFSAEAGKRIQQGNGLWIEPQVELTYGKVSAVDYVTKNNVNVAQDSMGSLVGRIGFSLGKDIEKGNVYARASYLYDFDGETKAVLNGVQTLENDLGGGWWEVGVGANINLSKATYIYADIEKTFGGEVDTNWQWNLGVRYSF